MRTTQNVNLFERHFGVVFISLLLFVLFKIYYFPKFRFDSFNLFVRLSFETLVNWKWLFSLIPVLERFVLELVHQAGFQLNNLEVAVTTMLQTARI
jgi:hypothetical protein